MNELYRKMACNMIPFSFFPRWECFGESRKDERRNRKKNLCVRHLRSLRKAREVRVDVAVSAILTGKLDFWRGRGQPVSRPVELPSPTRQQNIGQVLFQSDIRM